MKKEALKIAVLAAKQAGEYLQEMSRTVLQINTKAVNDFVTNVDRESENIIVSTLRKHFPLFGVLAEESVQEKITDDTPYWIIDPLDGTTNYVHRFPIYCVSIALYWKEEPLVGVVYDPNRNHLFTAIKGGGAYLNDSPVKVSDCTRLQDSLIGTGFPFRNFEIIEQYTQCFSAILRNSHGIRRPGVAAIDLAYVAWGRLDGFWEHGLQPWDAAAGALLIEEAGGSLTDFTGGNKYLFGRTLVASNGRIHPELFEIVSRTMPHTYPK